MRLAPSMLLSLLLASGGCDKPSREVPLERDGGAITIPNRIRACEEPSRCVDACNRGSVKDCVAAANSYSTGDGVDIDEARATTLFESACALKSGSGCNLAGRMHEFGHGVRVDFTKAFALYERACGLRFEGGCYNVAIMAERGRGTPVDLPKAASLYREVCAAGSPAACEAASRLAAAPKPHD
jgi:uncharacterized protein